MEWLLAHGDEEIPANWNSGESPASAENRQTSGEDAAAAAPSSSGAEPSAGSPVAKSLKCDDCGKVLKDHTEVEYHAAKTGHSNFSESTEEKKALTEEEKKAQLALIEEKLKQKRVEREEREKADALEREKNRIRSGKDMAEAKRRMEELEMKKSWSSASARRRRRKRPVIGSGLKSRQTRRLAKPGENIIFIMEIFLKIVHF